MLGCGIFRSEMCVCVCALRWLSSSLFSSPDRLLISSLSRLATLHSISPMAHPSPPPLSGERSPGWLTQERWQDWQRKSKEVSGGTPPLVSAWGMENRPGQEPSWKRPLLVPRQRWRTGATRGKEFVKKYGNPQRSRGRERRNPSGGHLLRGALVKKKCT